MEFYQYCRQSFRRNTSIKTQEIIMAGVIKIKERKNTNAQMTQVSVKERGRNKRKRKLSRMKRFVMFVL